jgi:Phosphopantetheine attachment site
MQFIISFSIFNCSVSSSLAEFFIDIMWFSDSYNFFETGISSLMLVEMHQCIDYLYPDKVDITDMFEYQTINDLSEFIKNN